MTTKKTTTKQTKNSKKSSATQSANGIKVGKNSIQGDVSVMRIKPYCYVISGEVLTGEMSAHGWAHAKVVEQDGCVTINPFNKRSTPSTPAEDRTVKQTKGGSITLSPGGMKVVVRLSLDRGKDSPEAFKAIFDELVDNNYTNEIINFELERNQ